jgi:hypothetical protein
MKPAPTASSEPQRPRTIDDDLKAIRQEEARQHRACTAAIKAVHAEGPNMAVPTDRSPGLISRGPGNIAKLSPNGKFIGWYREGQTAGLPSQRMPLEVELAQRLEAYLQFIRAANPKSQHAQTLGQRSGIARAAQGYTSLILSTWDTLTQAQDPVPRHHRAKRIAQQVGCSVKHARAVIHAHRKNAA